MDRGDAGEPFDRPMQGRDAPILHLVHEDVERGLVELDHVDAIGRERARLLVEQTRERHGQLDLVAVIAVGDRVHDRHRAGKRDFQPPFGMRAGKPRFGRVDATLEPQRPDDGRHHRLIAVLANSHLHPMREIDPLHVLEKTVDEMLT